jgi:hypothetical protein
MQDDRKFSLFEKVMGFLRRGGKVYVKKIC